MSIDELYKKTLEEILNHPTTQNRSTRDWILILHESATKLWQSDASPTEHHKLYAKAANALISSFCIMNALQIKDVEKCLLDRLEHLKTEKQNTKNSN